MSLDAGIRLFPEEGDGAPLAALLASSEPSMSSLFQVKACGRTLAIPYRIYVDGEALESAGCDPTFVDAVLTRRHNGFVRAEALARLMTAAPAWAPAYIVPLVGEYVVEIIEQIEAALTEREASTYGAFVEANPAFMTLTRQRVVSYWNCYWRGRWRQEGYPGARVLARLATF